jgi:hypothetical protein
MNFAGRPLLFLELRGYLDYNRLLVGFVSSFP